MRENPLEVALKREIADRVAALLVTMEVEMVEQIDGLVERLALRYCKEKPTLRLVK